MKLAVKIVAIAAVMVVAGFTAGMIVAPKQVAETKNLKPSELATTVSDVVKAPYKLSPLKPNNRLVHIYGEITNDSAGPVVQQLLKLGNSPEPIYIYSLIVLVDL